ncbi:MAG: hypothetical protein JOZ91_10945 [Candidatus Eremiobacteraeota bacterium]|nr:hypothetical protein [Candidatus Eremiobacteraeota bacterium]
MRVHHRSAFVSCVALAACLVAVAGVAHPALAQPSQASSPAAMSTTAAAPAPAQPVKHASQLVKVSACDPKLNLMQSGGYMAGPGYYGYAPGWGYRGGYWGDPYGFTAYQPPVTTTMPQLGIDYVNISHKTMSEIEFGLVANGRLVAEVRDVGTFSPGAEIKHKFGVSANIFPLQTGLPQCVPLRIAFADGTHWRNPALPPHNKELYGPVGYRAPQTSSVALH